MPSTSEAIAEFDASPAAPSGKVDVWDRLWQHRPSQHKDALLLAREQRSTRWSLLVDRLESIFGTLTGLDTIELGSGRGDLSVLLAQRGARVTLLDANDKALDQARQRFDRLGLTATYEHADIFQKLEACRGCFDVALSSGLIEHFKDNDRTRVIRAHHDVLKPGGLAVISVPNAWCVPYRVWKLYLELRGWWPYGMELPYGKSELLRRAREAGLRHAEVRCLGFWQSISSHWARGLLGYDVDWSHRVSRLDPLLGATLLLFGRRFSAVGK